MDFGVLGLEVVFGSEALTAQGSQACSGIQAPLHRGLRDLVTTAIIDEIIPVLYYDPTRSTDNLTC